MQIKKRLRNAPFDGNASFAYMQNLSTTFGENRTTIETLHPLRNFFADTPIDQVETRWQRVHHLLFGLRRTYAVRTPGGAWEI